MGRRAGGQVGIHLRCVAQQPRLQANEADGGGSREEEETKEQEREEVQEELPRRRVARNAERRDVLEVALPYTTQHTK